MLKKDWAFTAVSSDYPCGCSACVNVPHQAEIHMDQEQIIGRVYTTWGEWETNALNEGKHFRKCILALVEIEDLRIQANELQVWAFMVFIPIPTQSLIHHQRICLPCRLIFCTSSEG